MKKINFFSLIGIGVLTLGIGINAIFSHNQESAPVYAEDLDTISIKLNVQGDFDKESLDYKFEFKEVNESGHNVYDLKIHLEDGTQFHLLRNYDSANYMGHNDLDPTTNSPTYLKISGDYFVIIGTNDYLITLVDNSAKSWTKNLYVKPYTPVNRTLTYHLSDTETDSDVYVDGTRWTSKFYEKEGYYLEGWYTEQEFINKFERNDRVDGDMDLYPNYVQTEDYTIIVKKEHFYFADKYNPVMHVNYRRGHLDNALVTVEINNCTLFDGYYMVTVDASKSYNTISLGASIEGNTRQSAEITLTPHKTYIVNLLSSTLADSIQPIEAKLLSYSLVSLLYDLGGEWGVNNGATPNCATNYLAAKNMFLTLDEPNYEQWVFQNSTGEIWDNARQRYESWCHANGDGSPYNSTSGTNNRLSVSATNYNFLIPTIAAAICLTLVVVIVIKKRREN